MPTNLFTPEDMLFIINATTPAEIQAARPLIATLIAAERPAWIHTIPGADAAAWSSCPHLTVFSSNSPVWPWRRPHTH
ncbi:MAG: hypothetical protein KJ063_09850 [Anaerolineae bacterium]|nr:hypothetical protein [Anaerolineae bacterium]